MGNQSVISLSSNPPDSFDKNSNVDSLYFEHLLQWICFITLIHAHTGLIALLVSGEGCYGSKQVWLTPCGPIIQEKLKTATKRLQWTVYSGLSGYFGQQLYIFLIICHWIQYNCSVKTLTCSYSPFLTVISRVWQSNVTPKLVRFILWGGIT